MEELVLNQYELKRYCKEFCLKNWGESFDIDININGRLTRSLGAFYHNRRTKEPLYISISKRLLIKGSYKMETILSVVKHELCHYHLFRNGKEYKDNTPTFDREALKIGATLTHTIRVSGNVVVGYCSCCDKVVLPIARPKHYKNPNRFTSKCCDDQIYYKEKCLEDTSKIELSNDDLEFLNKIGKGINKEIVKEIQKEIPKEVIKETPKNETIKIEDIVQPGKKGVTRTQVHPAVEKSVDEKSPEKLRLIKQHYPDYFNQVCMYISKKRLRYIQEIGLN